MEQEALDRAVERSREVVKKRRVRGADEQDYSFIDEGTPEGRRNLRRASDPDAAIDRGKIDEARAMDHAERTNQLPAPVDRSTRHGADLVIGTPQTDKVQHWSMKSVRPGRSLADSKATVLKEIDKMADKRRSDDGPYGVVVDLRHMPDSHARAEVRLAIQNHANVVNRTLQTHQFQPIPIAFIEP